jgi:hypothetical protein
MEPLIWFSATDSHEDAAAGRRRLSLDGATGLSELPAQSRSAFRPAVYRSTPHGTASADDLLTYTA